MKIIRNLLFILLLPALIAHGQTLELIYSGNLDGELEPCGCTLEGDFGGIQRRATVIDKLRADNNDLILISTGGLFSTEMGNDEIKHRFILSGLGQLDYDAIGVQWADLIHGPALLNQSELPFAAGNWQNDDITHSIPIQSADDDLFFTQWLPPEQSPYLTMKAISPITENPESLIRDLRQARAKGMLTLVGVPLPLEQASALLPLELIDILLIEARYETYGEPELQGPTLVLQPGSRGQRLGHLTLELNESGRIGQWRHRVIELPDGIPGAPRLDPWYDAYNQALRDDYEQRVALRVAREGGTSVYAGEQQCKNCHPVEHDRWLNSEHAKAYPDLEAVGKAYDPHCLECHTLGFMEPGGFLDKSISTHLMNVQCENCHGAAQAHAASAGREPTTNKGWSKEKTCAQCHSQEHSPSFNPETYWPKIAHP